MTPFVSSIVPTARTLSLKKLLQTIRHRLLPNHMGERDLGERRLTTGGWLKFGSVQPSGVKRRWTAHRGALLDPEHRLRRSDTKTTSAEAPPPLSTVKSAQATTTSGVGALDLDIVPELDIEAAVEVCGEAVVSNVDVPEEAEAYGGDEASSSMATCAPEVDPPALGDSAGEASAADPPTVPGESAVVRGFRAGRSSDLSQLLGFTELVRGTRRAVRKIVDDASEQHEAEEAGPEPETKTPPHWMAAALRHAGIPRAVDVPLTPESDSDEAWKTASEWCGLSADQVAGLVAAHFRLRAVDLESAEIEQMEDIPDSLMRRYGALPIAQSDRYLILAVSDPSDPHLGEAFSFVARRSVSLVVAPPEAIAEGIWKTYGWMP